MSYVCLRMLRSYQRLERTWMVPEVRVRNPFEDICNVHIISIALVYVCVVVPRVAPSGTQIVPADGCMQLSRMTRLLSSSVCCWMLRSTLRLLQIAAVFLLALSSNYFFLGSKMSSFLLATSTGIWSVSTYHMLFVRTFLPSIFSFVVTHRHFLWTHMSSSSITTTNLMSWFGRNKSTGRMDSPLLCEEVSLFTPIVIVFWSLSKMVGCGEVQQRQSNYCRMIRALRWRKYYYYCWYYS